MKNVFIIVPALFVCAVLAKPMESIDRYNIILVHGAADSLSGMDCDASMWKMLMRIMIRPRKRRMFLVV